MRILAVSDTEEAWLSTYFDRDRLAGVDLIVSCGDLSATYLENLVTIANAPLAYVPGNHDTSFEHHAPQGCVSLEGRIRSCRGLRLMGLGGSVAYNDRVYGFSETEMTRRAMRMALIGHAAGGADVLVTHAPVRGYGDLDDLPHRGFEAFNVVLDTLKPALMLHGHVHMEYGRIEREHVHPSGTRIINVCGHQFIDIPDGDIPERAPRLFFPVEEL